MKPIMLYLYGESALGWNTTQCIRMCVRGPVYVSARVPAHRWSVEISYLPTC